MNYLNCCLKVQSLYKISYSVRHPQVYKYLNWLSVHGIQRVFPPHTNLLGHNLTQKLNWHCGSYQKTQHLFPFFSPSVQSLISAPNLSPWVTPLQAFMNWTPLEKQRGQLSPAVWLTAQPAPCTEKHRAKTGISEKGDSASPCSNASSKCTLNDSLALSLSYDKIL